MNRRNFLRNLVLGAAAVPVALKAASKPAVIAAVDLARGPDRVKFWMCSNPQGKYSINPAWENAEYRVDFITHASERRTAERIAKAFCNQRPYTPEQLRSAGLEWHRGQTIKT